MTSLPSLGALPPSQNHKERPRAEPAAVPGRGSDFGREFTRAREHDTQNEPREAAKAQAVEQASGASREGRGAAGEACVCAAGSGEVQDHGLQATDPAPANALPAEGAAPAAAAVPVPMPDAATDAAVETVTLDTEPAADADPATEQAASAVTAQAADTDLADEPLRDPDAGAAEGAENAAGAASADMPPASALHPLAAASAALVPATDAAGLPADAEMANLAESAVRTGTAATAPATAPDAAAPGEVRAVEAGVKTPAAAAGPAQAMGDAGPVAPAGGDASATIAATGPSSSHAAPPPAAPVPAAMPASAPMLQPIAAAAVSLGAQGRVTVEMDPPELGHVEVRMELGTERPRIVVLAERPETLDLLRRHSADLEKLMSEAGIDLGNADLSFGQRGRDEGADALLAARGGEADVTAPDTRGIVPLLAGMASGLWSGTGADGRVDLRL
ncbi:flagellar hook-length control protein FliK [Futiania mangrovi]|uniref:Flagellar hook-length control protein FliK n=1 Tax=Futiania mangrovi TaxID=2959716 RepID=A0A9J6PDU2_9PROT|nr:flagellar hook-length control protein FliK [Futiania mangrovii]MCP1336825.1 flagellar hook-length control protein FliK [Futiania mangrovii]